MSEQPIFEKKSQITFLEPVRVFDKHFLEMVNSSVETKATTSSYAHKSKVQVREREDTKPLENLFIPTMEDSEQKVPWSYFLLKNRNQLNDEKVVPRRPFWGFKPFMGFDVQAGENSFILPSKYLDGVHICREPITNGDPKYYWDMGPFTYQKTIYQVIDLGLWMGGERLDVNEKYYLVFLAQGSLAFAVKELSDMSLFHPRDIRWTGQTYESHWRAGVHGRLNSYLLDLRWFDSLNKLKSEKTQTVNAKIKMSRA